MLKSNTGSSNIYAMWKKYLISIKLNILLAFVRNGNRGGNELLFFCFFLLFILNSDKSLLFWLAFLRLIEFRLLSLHSNLLFLILASFKIILIFTFSTKPFFIPCISLSLTQAFPPTSEFMLCALCYDEFIILCGLLSMHMLCLYALRF